MKKIAFVVALRIGPMKLLRCAQRTAGGRAPLPSDGVSFSSP